MWVQSDGDGGDALFALQVTGAGARVRELVSGAGAFLSGFLYSNMRCVDSEIVSRIGDVKFRSMIAMKCFVSGNDA